MLLEILTDADNFRIENSPLQITLVAWDLGIDESLFTNILDFMVSIGLMQRDPEWIWNDHLLERMQPVLNKRKVMQENYQIRWHKPAEEKKGDTPPAPPKEPKKRKAYLTEENWATFLELYKTPGKNNDSSIYKAKKLFLALENTYKHSGTNEVRDTWSDIQKSLPLWVKSQKWMSGYKHMATTWINGHMWEIEPEPYNQNKGKAPNQQNNGKASSKPGYSDHKV